MKSPPTRIYDAHGALLREEWHVPPGRRGIFKFADDPTVYIYTKNGEVLPFTSWGEFTSFGYTHADIQVIPRVSEDEPPAPPETPDLNLDNLAFLHEQVVRVRKAGGKAEIDGIPLSEDIAQLAHQITTWGQWKTELTANNFKRWADNQTVYNASTPLPSYHLTTPELPVEVNDYVSGNIYISSPELHDWSTSRSAFGRDHMRKWIDDKCKNAHGAHHELGIDLGNANFDLLHHWLNELKAHGKKLHLWAQGDQKTEHGISRAEWSRVEENHDRLVDVLEDYPGIVSIGIGFDTAEWMTQSRFHEWVQEMREDIPWLIVGGRPQGAPVTNHHVLSWEQLDAWNDPCSYASIEYGHIGSEDLVKQFAQRYADKPRFSENRDRLGNQPAPGFTGGYSYQPHELAQVVRWYRKHHVAGIIADWTRRWERDHPRATRTLPDEVYAAIDTPEDAV